MPLARSRLGLSGTVTTSLTPSNESAPPNLPAVVRVAPEIVPALPRPDASVTCRPTASLNPYAATRPGGAGGRFNTVTETLAVEELPARSVATADSVCAPFDVVVEFHVIEYGGAMIEFASAMPSSLNCTRGVLTESAAFAERTIEPDTEAPPEGAVIEIVGGVVSVRTKTDTSVDGALT